MLNPLQAVALSVGQWRNFSGRSRRSEFWWTHLIYVVLLILMVIAEVFLFPQDYSPPLFEQFTLIQQTPSDALSLILRLGLENWWAETKIFPISTAFKFIMIIPLLALWVRRLHDTNRKAWWIVLPTIIFVFAEPYIELCAFVMTSLMMGSAGITTSLVFSIALISSVLIALILWVIAVIFAFFDSQPSDNRYGASPKFGSQIEGVF